MFNLSLNKTLPLSLLFLVLVVCATAQTSGYSLHTIKTGETLSGIAKANKTTVGELMRLNRLNSKSLLRAGKSIKIPMAEGKATGVATTPEPAITQAAKPIAPPPAQTVTTPAPEQTGDLTMHTIKEGETLSAIAKANKTTVGDIMRLNGMNTKSILKVGASIRIPGTEVKTPITATTPTPEATPVTPVKPTTIIRQEGTQTQAVAQPTSPIKYTVVKGDNLYRLSKTYKTTEAQLMQWNGMKNDGIRPGQVLIVGQGATQETLPAPVETIIKDTPVMETPKKSLPFVARDTAKTGIAAIKDSTVVIKADTAVAVKPLATAPPMAKDTTGLTPLKEMGINTDPPPIPKYARFANEEGFYAGYFNRKNISNNSTTGDAGTFKSSSGWNDKKYYVLINDINQGTIVRLTANNKSICAKVVGPLPNIKEDLGLLARINTAAADALGITDPKFGVLVNY